MQQYIFLKRKFLKRLDDVEFKRNVLSLKMIQDRVYSLFLFGHHQFFAWRRYVLQILETSFLN